MKIKYNSPVILTFVLICLLVLILGGLTGNKSTLLLFSVYKSPLSDPLFYFRLFSHVLGHVNFQHFFSNMLIILLVGPILEEKYGSKITFYLIIFTALITGIFNVIFFNTKLLGASGIAFMLILLSSFVNIKKGEIPITLILIAFMYIGNEIYLGIVSDDNISRMTHILGGALGAFFGFVLNTEGVSYD